jgi:putative transposase
LAAVRYIERNPVSAGLCRDPWDWHWSSAKAHLQGRDDVLVQVEPMQERITDWRDYLQSEEEAKEHQQLKRHIQTGRPLGDDRFIEMLEYLTGRTLKLCKPGPKSPMRN